MIQVESQPDLRLKNPKALSRSQNPPTGDPPRPCTYSAPDPGTAPPRYLLNVDVTYFGTCSYDVILCLYRCPTISEREQAPSDRCFDSIRAHFSPGVVFLVFEWEIDLFCERGRWVRAIGYKENYLRKKL